MPILDYSSEVQRCNEMLINLKIINYLVVAKNADSTKVELTTNFPYRNRMCGNYSETNDEIIAIFDEDNGLQYRLQNINLDLFYISEVRSKLFPPKIPRSLHGCEIQIVTGLWPPNVIDINREIFPGIEVRLPLLNSPIYSTIFPFTIPDRVY